MSGDRYKFNPFLIGMTIPAKNKQIRLSKLGKDDNVLVNQTTGELLGTHVTTFKSVDSEQFVKLFTANIALTFELKSPGIKALSVLLWSVQHNALLKDEVPLDALVLDAFVIAHQAAHQPPRLSLATFMRGLAELVKSQIIAKTMRRGWYFINPNFVFNGDRIAFTTIISKNKKEYKQIEIFSDKE